MKSDRNLFDSPEAEARSEARAEADISGGRVISHGAVRRWLESGAAPSDCRGLARATDLPKIVWTEEAVEHLEAIVTYLSVYDRVRPNVSHND